MKRIYLDQTNSKNIFKETIEVLQSGGLVIYPSDTVYGLLVDATNQKAVKKLIAFKNRPPGKPISVFVSGWEMLHTIVEGTKHKYILETILPGPFTVILPSKQIVSPALESEQGTLGVRFPQYEDVIGLVTLMNKPVTATSANLSGRSPHYSVDSLLNELPHIKKDLVDLIVDKGRLPRNKPSTIIDLTESTVKVIRKGDITFHSKNHYTSTTPTQTKKLAAYLLNKYMSHSTKSLVFILEGDLGIGKTVFTKGLAQLLGIKNIISPTYVIYYEYSITVPNQYKNFIHFDLYQIQDADEFNHLGIDQMVTQKNIFCIEWGEKAKELLPLFQKHADIVYIKMDYINSQTRSITVST